MKKKRLKIFAASSLAIMMGASVLCGVLVAPMNSAQATISGATASSNSANLAGAAQLGDSAQGLITPKEDDPVVYTTESGLEIKFGTSFELSNSALKGFFYITTRSGTTEYHWIIIGQNFQSSTYGSGIVSGDLSLGDVIDTCFDDTPAGKALLKDYMRFVQYKTEIPTANSVLCLSNDIVATGCYNLSVKGGSYTWYPSTYSGNEDIVKIMEDYYTNRNFGLSSIISKIQNVNITTKTYTISGSNWNNGWHTNTISRHIYPLGCNSSSTFYWANYLTGGQIKLSSSQWLRGYNREDTAQTSGNGGYYRGVEIINSSGSQTFAYCNNTSIGYRPAFVLKLL